MIATIEVGKWYGLPFSSGTALMALVTSYNDERVRFRTCYVDHEAGKSRFNLSDRASTPTARFKSGYVAATSGQLAAVVRGVFESEQVRYNP